MNLLNRVGGALLLLGLGLAVIIGFQSPTGRQFWDGVWQAGATVVGYFRTQIERLTGEGTDGNLAVSVGVAAVGLIIVLTLMKWPITVRVYTILLILATVVAIVLYNPSIVA
jgi:hypothetical protein